MWATGESNPGILLQHSPSFFGAISAPPKAAQSPDRHPPPARARPDHEKSDNWAARGAGESTQDAPHTPAGPGAHEPQAAGSAAAPAPPHTNTRTGTPRPTAKASEAQDPDPRPQKQRDGDGEGTRPAGQGAETKATSSGDGEAATARTKATDRATRAAANGAPGTANEEARNTRAREPAADRANRSAPEAHPIATKRPGEAATARATRPENERANEREPQKPITRHPHGRGKPRPTAKTTTEKRDELNHRPYYTIIQLSCQVILRLFM